MSIPDPRNPTPAHTFETREDEMDKRVMVTGATALAVIAVTAQNGNAERSALIDKMHTYYVKQFDNLQMTKDGVFGASRIESSKIKHHGRSGGDPGYESKDWYNMVQIYGNHGQPLVPDKMVLRYSRLPNPLPAGYKEAEMVPKNPADARDLPKVKAGLVQTAANRWKKGDMAPWGTQYGHVFMQVRPIVLDKSACLGCHTGMKLGQPVAAMVYTVGRRSKG